MATVSHFGRVSKSHDEYGKRKSNSSPMLEPAGGHMSIVDRRLTRDGPFPMLIRALLSHSHRTCLFLASPRNRSQVSLFAFWRVANNVDGLILSTSCIRTTMV